MMNRDEAFARWARVRRLMDEHELDALVAVDRSRDEIQAGAQRWLTGYIPVGGPAAALLDRDGRIELISERIGRPVAEHYAAQDLPIELVNGFSDRLLAERISRRRPRRLGIAESGTFSWSLAAALGEGPSPVSLVDVSAAVGRLRLRKSAYELALVRESCRIADAVWEQVPDLFRVGRANRDVVADIDHLARREGSEGGFHLLLKLPFRGRPMQSVANPELVEADSRYLIEISPRYEGYYSQLTIPATTRRDDERLLRGYHDVVEAKRAAQPLMRPGADLTEVAARVEGFLAERGHKMTSLSLGHFCGMALEEPRHDPSMPFRLEEGMTLIFHPVLADPECFSLMRADTYMITENGAERLNRYDGTVVTAS
ncbi:M24 family metallopeptidase [Streptomyces sp. NPDC056296]|uniref:M24 family metallopeptidase n=1 Tax=Streptomyces sp. NPDC056296 TaxID=3345775 RepID=UPI0035E3807A